MRNQGFDVRVGEPTNRERVLNFLYRKHPARFGQIQAATGLGKRQLENVLYPLSTAPINKIGRSRDAEGHFIWQPVARVIPKNGFAVSNEEERFDLWSGILDVIGRSSRINSDTPTSNVGWFYRMPNYANKGLLVLKEDSFMIQVAHVTGKMDLWERKTGGANGVSELSRQVLTLLGKRGALFTDHEDTPRAPESSLFSVDFYEEKSYFMKDRTPKTPLKTKSEGGQVIVLDEDRPLNPQFEFSTSKFDKDSNPTGFRTHFASCILIDVDQDDDIRHALGDAINHNWKCVPHLLNSRLARQGGPLSQMTRVSQRNQLPALTLLDLANQRPDFSGESTKPPSLLAAFEQFWMVYPRRTDRDRELAASIWQQKGLDREIHLILNDVCRRKERDPYWTRSRQLFIPLASTYLRERQWDHRDRLDPSIFYENVRLYVLPTSNAKDVDGIHWIIKNAEAAFQKATLGWLDAHFFKAQTSDWLRLAGVDHVIVGDDQLKIYFRLRHEDRSDLAKSVSAPDYFEPSAGALAVASERGSVANPVPALADPNPILEIVSEGAGNAAVSGRSIQEGGVPLAVSGILFRAAAEIRSLGVRGLKRGERLVLLVERCEPSTKSGRTFS